MVDHGGNLGAAMIGILIPSITPRLAASAVYAVSSTLLHPSASVIVDVSRLKHGPKLDAMLSNLPDTAEWLVTMDDDAAPMRAGWLQWLLEKIGEGVWGGFHRHAGGNPHPLGAAYRVAWLREIKASFTPRRDSEDRFLDVGQGFSGPEPFIARPARPEIRPWWLRTADAAEDDEGRLIWAHLGGGTIGSTGVRVPTSAWPGLVRRYLARVRY